MSLTDAKLSNVKPKDKPYKLTDGAGLYLLVNPNGGRWWRFDYRYASKRKTLSMGVYPDISLRVARERRGRARQAVAEGRDPADDRQREKEENEIRHANTFEVVAREWHAKFAATWVESHASRVLRRFEKDIFPALGNCPIEDLSAPRLLVVLRRIEERGAIESAHRVKTSVWAGVPIRGGHWEV